MSLRGQFVERLSFLFERERALMEADVNAIYCPECFKRLWPEGREESSCTHGAPIWGHPRPCIECGRKRLDGDVTHWHCLGSLP